MNIEQCGGGESSHALSGSGSLPWVVCGVDQVHTSFEVNRLEFVSIINIITCRLELCRFWVVIDRQLFVTLEIECSVVLGFYFLFIISVDERIRVLSHPRVE